MYLTQAKAKLWFGVLALLAGGCGNRGECDFAPERCAQREVSLNLTTMERSIGGELSVSFEGEHRQSGNLIVELLPMKEEMAAADNIQELINTTPPANVVAMKIAPNMLRTGSYSVRVRQNDHELTHQDQRPTLQVTETQIRWQPSNRIEFAAPANVWFKNNCKMTGIMDLSGVWVGLPSAAPATPAETLMSRNYTDCQGNLKTQFVSTNNPPSQVFENYPYDAPSALDLWPSAGASTQIIEAIRNNNAGYQLTGVALQNPDARTSFGDVNNITFDHIALTVKADLSMMLVTVGGSFHGYMLQPNTTPAKIAVDMGPFINIKIKSIVGYANSTISAPSFVGFVLMDDKGIPYLLKVDQGNIVYDSKGSTLLQNSMKSESIAPLAIATGDINGDGLTDLAVVGSNKTVSFYLQLMDGDFYAASTMTLPSAIKQPSSIAIGQVDGQGFNDLLIGDSQPQACGQTLCNKVSVFLNVSTVVN